MKKIIICLLITLAPHLSFADEKSKRESLESLLKISNASAMIDNIYAQMDAMMASMRDQQGIVASEKEIFDRYTSNVVSAMKSEMSWEQLKEPIMEIYMKYYTEKEIQDIVAFYQTESGQSMLQKMPTVMQDSSQIGQVMMKKVLPKIQAASKQLQKELALARAKK